MAEKLNIQAIKVFIRVFTECFVSIASGTLFLYRLYEDTCSLSSQRCIGLDHRDYNSTNSTTVLDHIQSDPVKYSILFPIIILSIIDAYVHFKWYNHEDYQEKKETIAPSKQPESSPDASHLPTDAISNHDLKEHLIPNQDSTDPVDTSPLCCPSFLAVICTASCSLDAISGPATYFELFRIMAILPNRDNPQKIAELVLTLFVAMIILLSFSKQTAIAEYHLAESTPEPATKQQQNNFLINLEYFKSVSRAITEAGGNIASNTLLFYTLLQYASIESMIITWTDLALMSLIAAPEGYVRFSMYQHERYNAQPASKDTNKDMVRVDQDDTSTKAVDSKCLDSSWFYALSDSINLSSGPITCMTLFRVLNIIPPSNQAERIIEWSWTALTVLSTVFSFDVVRTMAFEHIKDTREQRKDRSRNEGQSSQDDLEARLQPGADPQRKIMHFNNTGGGLKFGGSEPQCACCKGRKI